MIINPQALNAIRFFTRSWFLFLPFVLGLAIQSVYDVQYQTVIVSVVTLSTLVLSLIFHWYIFPRSKIPLLLLVALFAFLPTVSLFRQGAYESGDFNLHIYRIMSFYDTLLEGNIMPSWAADANASYGNPIFIFNYSLPYYIVSLFHFIGFSFIASMKIMLGLTFVLSGIFMFIASRKIFNNELAAFACAIFYLYNPYHLVDFHFRATPGESTLFMITPLLFFCLAGFLKERKWNYFIGISLTTLLLSMSHPMVSPTVLGLSMVFLMTYVPLRRNVKNILFALLAMSLGLLASLYHWAPFILFKEVMFPADSSPNVLSPFEYLFVSPYKYGFLFQGPLGELYPGIGLPQLGVVLISFVLFLKKKLISKLGFQYLTWIAVLLLLLFFMHPISNIVWDRFPIFWMLSGRLLFPMAVVTTFIAGYLVVALGKLKISKKLIYIILLSAVLSTILNWGHRRVIPDLNDQWLRNNIEGSTAYLEGRAVYFANTKWADEEKVWFNTIPDKYLEIVSGTATVTQLNRKTTEHNYIVNADSDTDIRENTLWYPGWTLKSGNKIIPTYPGEKGLITAKLPPGTHNLQFYYSDILYFKILKIFGLVILIGLILSLFFGSFFSHPKNFSRNLNKPNFSNRKKKSKQKK